MKSDINSRAPVRIALIGLGSATKPHLEAMDDPASGVVLSGVYNRSADKAEAVGARYNVPVFNRLEDLAADASIEAVIIATPPNRRADIVEMMAAAGKHILMEKPVERTLGAATALVETCEKHGVHLGIVFQHRFREGAKELTRLIKSGALGQIATVRADIPWWRDQAYYDEPGRGTLERDGGGVLMSQAIHTLDLMLSLTGPAASVQAMVATSRLHKMETEDFATAGIGFASGAIGAVMATTTGFPGGQESITIDAQNGSAVLRGEQLAVFWRDGRVEQTGAGADTGGGADHMAFPCGWHKELIADFAQAVRGAGAPLITGRAALSVHALIEAIIRSSVSGKATDVARV